MTRSKGSRPNKRESRPAGTERLPIISQLGGESTENSIRVDRVQFLARRFLLRPSIAGAIAELAWEGGAA